MTIMRAAIESPRLPPQAPQAVAVGAVNEGGSLARVEEERHAIQNLSKSTYPKLGKGTFVFLALFHLVGTFS
jgi:hypothetical protein